ncbi:hypothetical protein ES703_49984 [subsurface metagenome]
MFNFARKKSLLCKNIFHFFSDNNLSFYLSAVEGIHKIRYQSAVTFEPLYFGHLNPSAPLKGVNLYCLRSNYALFGGKSQRILVDC